MRRDSTKVKFTGSVSGVVLFGYLLIGGGSYQSVFGQTGVEHAEQGSHLQNIELAQLQPKLQTTTKPKAKPKLKPKPKPKPRVKPKPKSRNRSPEIISVPPESAIPGYPYLYQPIAVDADRDLLNWSLKDSPTGMLIDPDTGLIVAESLPSGQHDVTLNVDDGQGGSDAQIFTIHLQTGPVILSSPPVYTYSGTPYRYDVDAMDPSALELHYAIAAGPSGIHMDADTGLLEWTADTAGVFDIRISVTNSFGQTAAQSYSLAVLDQDGVRIISTAATEAYVSILYEYPLAVLNVPGAETTYYFNQAPTGMTIDAATGLVSWTPASGGSFPVEVVVMNNRGYMDTQRFTVVVISLEAMDQKFTGIVNDMFSNLENADIAAAMQYLTVDAQLRLGPLFNELIDDIDQVSANYTDPVRVSINPEMAEYMVRRTGGNGDRVFMVTFLRNNNREWRINDL